MLWEHKYLTEDRYLPEGYTEYSSSLKTIKNKGETGRRRGRGSGSLGTFKCKLEILLKSLTKG